VSPDSPDAPLRVSSSSSSGGGAGNSVVSVAVTSYDSEALRASCRATFPHRTAVHLSGALTTDVVAVRPVRDPSLEGKAGEENREM
jgi:hypothetical protein